MEITSQFIPSTVIHTVKNSLSSGFANGGARSYVIPRSEGVVYADVGYSESWHGDYYALIFVKDYNNAVGTVLRTQSLFSSLELGKRYSIKLKWPPGATHVLLNGFSKIPAKIYRYKLNSDNQLN